MPSFFAEDPLASLTRQSALKGAWLRIEDVALALGYTQSFRARVWSLDKRCLEFVL